MKKALNLPSSANSISETSIKHTLQELSKAVSNSTEIHQSIKQIFDEAVAKCSPQSSPLSEQSEERQKKARDSTRLHFLGDKDSVDSFVTTPNRKYVNGFRRVFNNNLSLKSRIRAENESPSNMNRTQCSFMEIMLLQSQVNINMPKVSAINTLGLVAKLKKIDKERRKVREIREGAIELFVSIFQDRFQEDVALSKSEVLVLALCYEDNDNEMLLERNDMIRLLIDNVYEGVEQLLTRSQFIEKLVVQIQDD